MQRQPLSKEDVMEDIEGPDQEWRELALRFLTRPVPGSAGPVRPQLIVGALPANLPIEIPLPEGVQVRGSLAAGMHLQVILQSELAPEDVGELYRQRLEADGWREPDIPQPSGFMQASGATYFRTFCRGPEGPALILSATARYPGEIGLDLNVDPASTPCRPHSAPPDLYGSLPALRPPERGRQKSSGGGASGGHAHQTASLVTDLDLAAVIQHYAGQLRAAGWQELAHGVDGPAAWSTWTVEEDGREKNAIFFALERPGKPHTYFLYVQADRAPDDGNWATFSGPSMS